MSGHPLQRPPSAAFPRMGDESQGGFVMPPADLRSTSSFDGYRHPFGTFAATPGVGGYQTNGVTFPPPLPPQPAPHVPAPHVPAPHVPASYVPAPHVLAPHAPAPHVLAPHAPAPHAPAPHAPAPHAPAAHAPAAHIPAPFASPGYPSSVPEQQRLPPLPQRLPGHGKPPVQEPMQGMVRGPVRSPVTNEAQEGQYSGQSQTQHREAQRRESSGRRAVSPEKGSSPSPPIQSLTKSSHTRIDPSQVPRPVVPCDVATQSGGRVYETDRYTMPPAPHGTYSVLDRGSASCRFVRMTLNQIPAHSNTLSSTCIPLACIFQPFADIQNQEESIPLIDNRFASQRMVEANNNSFGESEGGPVRCPRCHAYLNPSMSFSGQECLCNLCGHSFELPRFYQLLLAEYNRCTTPSEETDRPELWHGTVDHVAPASMLKKDANGEVLPPTAAAFCFVVESTYLAQANALTSNVVHAIRNLLPHFPSGRCSFSIILFDHHLHFFPIDPCITSVSQMKELVVSDVDAPFAPAPISNLCVDVSVNIDCIAHVLDAILAQMANGLPSHHVNSSSAGNAALNAGIEIVGQRGGGVVFVFSCTMPNTGVGSWERTGPTKEKENAHFFPRASTTKFYQAMEKLCLDMGVSVDQFCLPAPKNHIDIATLGHLPRVTGGHTHYLPDFDFRRDFDHVYRLISRCLCRPQGFDCHVKVRSSKGLNVNDVFAPWTMQRSVKDASSFHVPRIDADTSIAFALEHEEQLDGQSHAFIQFACLYVSVEGVRLIRTITLSLPVTNVISTTFRYAEIDTVVNLMTRKAAKAVMTGNKSWRDELTNNVADILVSYRVNCAVSSLAGQLILPDSLKLLPVYLSSIFKNRAFRSIRDVRSDEKLHQLLIMLGSPVSATSCLLYPRLYCVHRITKNERLKRIGQPTGVDGNFHMPPTIACSGEKVTTDGVYLMDNAHHLMFYAGADVDPTFLEEVVGFSAITDENAAECSILPERGPVAEALFNVVKQIRRERGPYPLLPLKFVPVKSLDESRFIWHLVEDRLGSEPCYVDLLCQVHRWVQTKIES